MASADREAKVKFTADVSDFNDQIKKANSTMTELNSELKLTNTTMSSTGTTTDGLRSKLATLQQQDETLAEKKEALNNKLEAAIKYFGEDSTEAEKLRTQLNNVETQSVKVEAQIDATNQQLEEQEKASSKAESALGQLTSTISEQESHLDDLKEQYANAVLEFGETSDEAQGLAGEISSLSSDLAENKSKLNDAQSAANEMAGAADKAGTSIEGASNSSLTWNVALGNLVSQGITKAVSSLGDLAKAAYDAAVELDEGYDIIIRKTGATGDALTDLTDSANKVFASLPVTMSEVGTAIGDVNTRFGVTGDTLEDLTTLFLQFSSINDTDVSTSITTTDKIMQQWNLDLDDTESLLGALTAASQDTGISMDSLMSTLSDNASYFQQLGFSLDESINLLAQMEASGVNSSTALTGLKKAVTTLTDAGIDQNEALMQVINSIKDAETETEALQIAQDVFGTKGAVEMTNAIRTERLNFDDLSMSIGDYGDTVTKTYNATISPWDEMTVATNNLKLAGSELANTLLTALSPAITGVVTVATALTNAVTYVVDLFTSTDNTVKELRADVEELTASIQANKEAYESAGEQIEATAGYYKQMAAELADLLDNEELSYAQQERLLSIIDQLNEAYPDLCLAYDDLAGAINMTNDELVEFIDTQASADQYAEDVAYMNELYDQQTQLAADLAEAQEALSEAQENYTDTSQALNEQMLNGFTVYDEQSMKISDLQALVNNLNEEYEANADALAEAEAKVNDYGDALDDASDSSVPQAVSAAEDLTARITDLADAYGQAYDDALKSVEGQMKLWDEADKTVAMDTDSIMGNIQSQIDYWAEYADNLENLLGRNIEGLDEFVASVDDGSAQSASYIAGLAQASDDDLTAIMELYQNLQDEQGRTAEDMANMEGDYENTLDDLVTATAQAISDMSLGDEATQAALDTMQGYIDGLDEGEKDSSKKTKEVAQSVMDSFRAEMGISSPSTVYEGYGKNTIEGYIKGLEDMESSLISKSKSLAKSVSKAYSDELQIGSPSKLFKDYGEYTGEGYIEGIEDIEPDVEKAMNQLSATTTAGFTGTSGSYTPSGLVADRASNDIDSLGAIRIQSIDYNLLAEAMAKQPITMQIGNREFGRLVKEAMA